MEIAERAATTSDLRAQRRLAALEGGTKAPPSTPEGGVPDPAESSIPTVADHIRDKNLGAPRETRRVSNEPIRQLPRRGARDRRWQGHCRKAYIRRRMAMKILCKMVLASEGKSLDPDLAPGGSFKTINWAKAEKLMQPAINAAIDLEVKQIADTYVVCHPVRETPAEYHRPVDLLDRKADGHEKPVCAYL
jgi:hypothetical protein